MGFCVDFAKSVGRKFDYSFIDFFNFFIHVCVMAYMRIDKKEGERYIRIIKSKRKDGKVVKETVYSLGKVSDYTPTQLRRFGTKFFELGGGDPRELLEGSIEELGRFNYGYYQLFSKIFGFYKLDKALDRIAKKHKLEIDLTNAVMLMLLERLHEPCSKRQNFLNQSDYLGIKPVELHQLYRSLDYLSQYSQLVQDLIYQPARNLFNQELDIVFYDVTTFYFESDVETEGALRQMGFGKDGKIGNTQILFGLLIDKHKQPIGYRIYKGNTFEGYTFEKALGQLKEQYQIKNIVVVADRGMLNRKNIHLTTENNYEFILGERLKSLPEEVKKYLTNIDHYTHLWVYNHQGESIQVRYCTYKHEGRTIIGTYSEKRARKDKEEREEKLRKAAQLLQQPSLLKKKAQYYFLTSKDQTNFVLDEEKIKQNQRYDGFLAISTNVENLEIKEVLDNYRHLYQIEHSFRTFKNHLETRPMFHWTDQRIEGHICLCYIAYTLLIHVQNKLLKSNIKLSEGQIRKALDDMQVSLVKNRDEDFYLRSANKENIDAIVNRLGLKKLPNVTPSKEIKNYL
jgi:transposase